VAAASGLAIVRRVVVEHGGSIEVTDNCPRGTRFVIELPCEAQRYPGGDGVTTPH
jgi:signal transduction histidine kinase